MFNLTIDTIKSLTNDIVYKRAMQIYEANKIKDFDFERIEGMGEVLYKLKANIEGSEENNPFYSTVIASQNNILQFYCSCENNYGYKEHCKHIISLLIKLYFNFNGTDIEENRKTVERLISNIKYGNRNLSIPEIELNMDVILCVEKDFNKQNYSLELKVGEKQQYVVKNMKNFINSINEKKDLEFGKNFTLNHKYHFFNEKDLKLIDIIKDIYEFNSINEDHYGNNQSIFFKGKKVYLPENHLKRIFGNLEDRNFSLKFHYEEYPNCKIINEDLPLKFTIKNEKNNIIINQINKLPIPFTKDGRYFFYNQVIYKPSSTQIELYRGLFNSLRKESKITINKDYIEEVAKFIIPAIKNISTDVSMDDTLKEGLIDEPLKTEMYFDKVDDVITCEVVFNYGDIKINPLNDSNEKNEKVAIRNLTNENKIVNLLEAYSFQNNSKEYVLDDEEKLLEFIGVGIEELDKLCEIFYSNSFRSIKIYSFSNVKTSLRINDKDLLEFDFNIEGVENNELKNIFEAIKIKKNYCRLKNGGFILLNSLGINDLSETIEYLDIKSSDLLNASVTLPKYNALYLSEKLKNNNVIAVETNKNFRETINNFKEIYESDFEIPKNLEKVLRDYQKTGFKWLRSLDEFRFGGILADEMGLGKTLQAASYINSKVEEDSKSIFMVICPTSLVYNWESEFKKFTPDLKITLVSGAKDLREKTIKDIKDEDVIITSYPLIRNDMELYKDICFSAVFIDEAQNIKNPNSQSAKAVKSINTTVKFAITGTPLENSLTELWSIFDFIMPGYLLSHSKFLKIYETPIVKNGDNKALSELNRHIKPFILRRLKKDVALELPAKIEHKMIVDLSEEQKKLYASYVSAYKEEITEEISKNGFGKSRIKILSALTRLRQICCEPSIFIENFKGTSAKMEALMELIETSIDENHRILIFSQFTSALKVIEDKINKKRIKYLYLDGKTKSQERTKLVDKFNEGYGSVFLISLKAGGTGLNLTGADTVIHYDPWWNPAVEDQASDRAHRIGQTKNVEVIKLITKGTIEEKIFELQEKKKEIFNNVMDEASEQNFIAKMDQEDLIDLFV
jgi:SNF2 family DNA or RNA helicase